MVARTVTCTNLPRRMVCIFIRFNRRPFTRFEAGGAGQGGRYGVPNCRKARRQPIHTPKNVTCRRRSALSAARLIPTGDLEDRNPLTSFCRACSSSRAVQVDLAVHPEKQAWTRWLPEPQPRSGARRIVGWSLPTGLEAETSGFNPPDNDQSGVHPGAPPALTGGRWSSTLRAGFGFYSCLTSCRSFGRADSRSTDDARHLVVDDPAVGPASR